jgi:hypothetical protein
MSKNGIRFAIAAVFAVLIVATPVAASVEVENPSPVAKPVVTLDLTLDVNNPVDACLNFTPAQAPDADAMLSDEGAEPVVTIAAAARPCKTCRERPTCECTYNGMPRISCVPCCYRNQFTGQQVCFD